MLMRKTAIKKEKRTRLQKSFQQTVLRLYRKKNLDEITINEVCKKVDVPRSSFYYHYNTVRDVLEEIENDFIKTVIDALSAAYVGGDDEKASYVAILQATLPLVKANENMLKAVIVERTDPAFILRWATVINYAFSHMGSDSLRELLLSYVAIYAIGDYLATGASLSKMDPTTIYEVALQTYELKKKIIPAKDI